MRQINGPRLRRILDHLQGVSKVADFTSSAVGVTPKMIQKTSKMVYLFSPESLTPAVCLNVPEMKLGMRWGWIIVLLIIGSTVSAWGARQISGSVLAVDTSANQVLIAMSGSGTQVTVRLVSKRLPRAVRAGSIIQAWGDFVKGNKRLFQARRLTTTDPTGVRRRLTKQRAPDSGSGTMRTFR